MPSLDEHTSSKFTKVLYIGDSGTGKTGSLTSLVEAGYKLRILDMDNNLTVLKEFVKRTCPDKIGNIDYETRRDKYKGTAGGPIISGVAKAYVDATKLMTTWSDDTIPSEWGEDTIFVLDSLSSLGRAAYDWCKSLNPTNVGKAQLQWYRDAQNSVEAIIGLLTSAAFECNVIVISHVQYVKDKDTGAIVKGQTNIIGEALGPNIPRYFGSLILAENEGIGKTAKRVIRTVPTNLITLKTPAPFKIDETYPLETGLAEIFAKLKEA